MRHLVAALCLLLIGAAAEATPTGCEMYWLYYGGKEGPEYLRIQNSWPLEQFERMQPWWYYEVNDRGRAPESRGSQLQWRPVSAPVDVKNLGNILGLRVFEIAYSPLDRVIVWAPANASFCPALLISADESIVAVVHSARVFRWQGMDIVHVRVEFQGTGHFQESVFLTAVDGNLVRLRMDDETEKPIREFYAAHRIEQFHRGLGFCEGRLVEQRLFEAGSAPCIGCRVEIRYGVNRSRLTVNRIAFTKIPESDKDCEMFPRR